MKEFWGLSLALARVSLSPVIFDAEQAYLKLKYITISPKTLKKNWSFENLQTYTLHPTP